MGRRNTDAERYERYQAILMAVAAKPEFTLAEIKEACPAVTAALVTSVVKQLEKDGVIERLGPKTKPSYRWLHDREQFATTRWIDSKLFSGQITKSPKAERPRERLLADGAGKLRVADLLAILVRSGKAGESALQAGEKIASRYAHELDRLADAGRGELKAISPAVGETAYCQIMAGIELGRRIAEAGSQREQPAGIKNTEDAVRFCREKFARLAADGAQEEFHIVTLDTKNQVINTHRVSMGLLDQTLVHPREIFRPAIKDAAKAVILVHNHPSGDPTPSEQDRVLTERLEEAGRTVDIQVLDHLIVARDGTVSVREVRGR